MTCPPCPYCSSTVLLQSLQRTGDGWQSCRWYGCVKWVGTPMNPHGPVGILWRFLNGCEIKRKRVKHAINVVASAWISTNTVQSVICFTGMHFSVGMKWVWGSKSNSHGSWSHRWMSLNRWMDPDGDGIGRACQRGSIKSHWSGPVEFT